MMTKTGSQMKISGCNSMNQIKNMILSLKDKTQRLESLLLMMTSQDRFNLMRPR